MEKIFRFTTAYVKQGFTELECFVTSCSEKTIPPLYKDRNKGSITVREIKIILNGRKPFLKKKKEMEILQKYEIDFHTKPFVFP